MKSSLSDNQKNLKALAALVCIAALGLLLRTAFLGKIPPGLHLDEASYAYNAWSVLKTGADEFGNRLPLYTPSFGTGKNPVYLYTQVAVVALFGLTEFAARLPAALFGSLTVVFTYLLALALTKRRAVALLSALFLCLCPWHILMSRFGFEVSSMPCFVALGLYLLVAGLEKPGKLPWAGLALGVSLYTYAPAIPLVAMLLPAFLFIYRSKLLAAPKPVAVMLLLFALLSLPHLLPEFKGKEQSAHLKNLSVFNPGNDFKDRKILSTAPPPFNRFSNSPPSVLRAAIFSRNYFAGYSQRFLFTSGDIVSLKTRVRGYGAFQMILIPLLIFGIFLLIYRKTPAERFLLVWFLVYPIGPAVSVFRFTSATRTLTALPLYPIIFALAAVYFYDALSRRLTPIEEAGAAARSGVTVSGIGNNDNVGAVSASDDNTNPPISATAKPAITKTATTAIIAAASIFTAIYAFNTTGFLKEYFVEYPKYSAVEWHAGLREAFAYAEANKTKYSQAVVSTNIPYSYIYVLFYTKYDPATLQKHPLNREGPYRTGRLGWYEIRDPYKQYYGIHQLFITGYWERPDLPPLPFGPTPGKNSLVKVSEYAP